MGWAFAPEQGYGGGWNLMDWDRESRRPSMERGDCIDRLLSLRRRSP